MTKLSTLPDWELCSYPDGPDYLERKVNGHELRIVPKIVDDWPRTRTAEVEVYGLIDKWLLAEAADVESCAAFLVDWAQSAEPKDGGPRGKPG